jgi:hypothetical protein
VQDVKKMNSIDEAFIYLSKAYDFDFNDNTKRELETILKSLSNEPSKDTLNEQPIIDLLKNFNNSLIIK